MSQGTLSLSSLFVTEEIFKGEYAQWPWANFGRNVQSPLRDVPCGQMRDETFACAGCPLQALDLEEESASLMDCSHSAHSVNHSLNIWTEK